MVLRQSSRRIYKKRPLSKKSSIRKMVAKAKTNRLVKLIKKVSLKQAETKHTHQIAENIQLYHNVPYVQTNLLYSEQSVSDNNTGTSNWQCRIGDEVVARGLQLKFWFANKQDRPNVMYKIIIFKYRSNTTTQSPDPYYTQGTSNYMIRDLDVEKFKIVKVINFNCQTSAQRILPDSDVFRPAESHKAVSVWIPIKQKIKYNNGTGFPLMTDYAYTVVCYDSYGTLTTDNIASFALNRKFYFKDP